VRILGEGSNGGTITHPSKVRDPLSTLGAMIRLLRGGDKADSPGLFRRWLEASGQDGAYKADFDPGRCHRDPSRVDKYQRLRIQGGA
jgi:hypothetical protein